MKITQKHRTEGVGWQTLSTNGVSEQVQSVLVFGDNTVLRQESRIQEVKRFFPQGWIKVRMAKYGWNQSQGSQAHSSLHCQSRK